MNRPDTKIAFVSPHCLLDFTNGAATATLDALSLLASQRFECQAFCSTHIDAWEEVLVEEILAQRGVPYQVRNAQIGQFQGRMIFTSFGPVRVTLFNSASTRGGWINDEEVAAFLTACELFLSRNRPDVVLTYGGDAVAIAVQKLVKHYAIAIVFGLHNFSYHNVSPFRLVDRIFVPTEYAQRHYRDKLGLDCEVLPLVMDAERVRTHHAPRDGHKPADGTRSVPATFVTFVNPEPRKGVHVFARIAEVLSRRRPDIPLLMVEGAAKRRFLSALGIDLGGLKNVTIWPNTPDPRKFYAVTKLILMPSLMENAGFVAMEAMTNGIPVLASNRGGLPETIGDAVPTSISPPVTRPRPATCPRRRGRTLGGDDHSPVGRRRRVRPMELRRPRACPAMASRPACADLPRFLQPRRPPARPAAGAAVAGCWLRRPAPGKRNPWDYNNARPIRSVLRMRSLWGDCIARRSQTAFPT